MMSLRNSAIVMRYDFEGRFLEVVDSAASRPCDVAGGPSSGLVIRTCVSRPESPVICVRRERGTAREGEGSLAGVQTMGGKSWVL